MNARLQNKLLTHVRKDDESGCWIWCGQISNSGHGRLMIKTDDNHTKIESAENVSYMGFIGEIPAGHFARQTCDNRLCVNPEHLAIFQFKTLN